MIQSDASVKTLWLTRAAPIVEGNTPFEGLADDEDVGGDEMRETLEVLEDEDDGEGIPM